MIALRSRPWPGAMVLLACCLTGCVRAPSPVVLPVHAIAVLPANNRTNDPLLIAGASFVEQYVFPTERYTVADALAANARTLLAQRGFQVMTPADIDGATRGQVPASVQDAAALALRQQIEAAVLYIEIRRWEPNVGTEPTFIIASVSMTLVEPATGGVLWSAEHPSRPVQTPGIVNLGDAYAVAARTLMSELLAPLRPVLAPSPSALPR